MSGMTPSGMTPGGMTPGAMTPAAMTPSGMTPSGMTPGGMTPSGMTPGGMTPRRWRPLLAAVAVIIAAAAGPARGEPGADPGDPTGSAGERSGSAGAGGSASGGTASGGTASAGSGSAAPGSAGSGSAGSGADRIIRMPLDAGAPDVSAAASPTVVRLGAHVTLYVTATFDDGVEVNLREPVDLGPGFEVRRRLSEDRRSADGRTTREWKLDIMPWELGDLEIAPIAVTFTAFGRAGQVRTNAVPMKITGDLGDSIEDPKEMRGLALPISLWARDWFWIWVATAAVAVAGVVIVALWVHRRRRRRTRRLVGGSIARPPRVDMTAERALERLLVIERSGVLGRDADRKLGYAEMVEVIRQYLGARYRLAIHDLTSSELLARLAGVAPVDELDGVTGWLEGCDLVKYGGLRATATEAGKALDDARALIVATSQPGAASTKEAA